MTQSEQSTVPAVTLTKVVPAARQVVFDAWLNPEALAQFMTPGPGMTVPKVQSDPTVGGKYLIVMRAGDQDLPHHGQYRIIDRPARLSFTWISPSASEGSVVTLDFKELSATSTELTLTHVGIATQEHRDNHRGGWGRILDTLATSVS